MAPGDTRWHHFLEVSVLCSTSSTHGHLFSLSLDPIMFFSCTLTFPGDKQLFCFPPGRCLCRNFWKTQKSEEMKKRLGETIAPKQGAPPQIGFIFESNMVYPEVYYWIVFLNLNFLPESQAINLVILPPRPADLPTTRCWESHDFSNISILLAASHGVYR